MNIFKSLFAVLLISMGSLSAQTFIGKLNPNPSEISNTNAVGNYNILAVMVEFQEDNDGATFGTGKFGSIYSGENLTSKDIIDPLPHGKSYFENHLEFAKNYYEKVSNGNVTISYTVFDNVITVSKTMRNYSPLPKSDDLSNVVDLAAEVWQIMEEQYSGSINLADYDIFTIFHAGVGRDVSLPGSIGNERDLPSVYLSENALKNYLGDDFVGFPGNGSQGVIKNTMIIPCTESREIDAVSGLFLLELSTNGLIVASIASHFGLPDLFNTETGLSAIGRFGLMDGQSIFTYGGLFPPEPSAWEKYYLGWITPDVVMNGENNVSLGIEEYLKVPINESEYYLVENRARDANADGITFTINSEGQTINMSFEKDTTGLRSYAVDSLKGVITDVDEYDWAVPGSGILIWHIDENVINANLASNTINNDINHKGVDVEEADGIQDIGEKFYTVLGDEVIGEGSEQDLWYSSNDARLYENRFAFDTKPNTNSNTGASSLITFDQFSDISNVMTFRVTNGVAGLSLVSSFNTGTSGLEENAVLSSYSDNNGTSVILFNNNNVYDFGVSGALRAEYDNFSVYSPAVLSDNNGNLVIAGVTSNQINVSINGLSGSVTLQGEPDCTPVLISESDGNYVYAAVNGVVYKYKVEAGEDDIVFTPSGQTDLFSAQIKQIIIINDNDNVVVGAVAGNNIKIGDYPQFTADDTVKQVISAYNQEGNLFSFIVTDEAVTLLENGSYFREISLEEYEGLGAFAAGFVTPDEPESFFLTAVAGNSIYAWNITGSILENFPVKKTGEEFKSVPSVFSFPDGSNSGIVAVTVSGNVYMINPEDGKNYQAYPVTVGGEIIGNPVVYNDNAGQYYMSFANKNGEVYTFREKYTGDGYIWNGITGASNQALTVSFDNNASGSFSFDEAKAYNWPNPVYDDVTYIRYYVGSDSDIEIKIFDIAGDFVDEITDEATGGFENETPWNVTDIQSGVYMAHLKVTGKAGGSASKIIKIAVIK